MTAPTRYDDGFTELRDKPEIENVTIPGGPNGVTIIAAPSTHCPPALPADKLEASHSKLGDLCTWPLVVRGFSVGSALL